MPHALILAALGDGRTLAREERPGTVRIHPDFRLVVLANRPGFPFLGNDFYRECGDVFATLVVATPDVASEMALLRAYGPHVPDQQLVSLLTLFSKLRSMHQDGVRSGVEVTKLKANPCVVSSSAGVVTRR